MASNKGHPENTPCLLSQKKNTLKVPKLMELARGPPLCSFQHALRVPPRGGIGNAQYEDQKGNAQAMGSPV